MFVVQQHFFMTTIFKFPLRPIVGPQELQLNSGYKLLTVQMQGSTPTLWALVDTENKPVTTTIDILFTGVEIEVPATEVLMAWHYIGTVQNAGIVAHIFDRQKSL